MLRLRGVHVNPEELPDMTAPTRPHRLADPDAPMCASGHRPFRDQAAAEASLRRARADAVEDPTRGRRPGETPVEAYLCKACTWWHTTSRSKRQTRSSLANRKDTRRGGHARRRR